MYIHILLTCKLISFFIVNIKYAVTIRGILLSNTTCLTRVLFKQVSNSVANYGDP